MLATERAISPSAAGWVRSFMTRALRAAAPAAPPGPRVPPVELVGELIRCLEGERLAPQGAAALAACPALREAAPARAFIAAQQRARVARGTLAVARLGEVLSRLAHAGVPALTFKGPVLSHQLYGDAGARAFGDLDVLIPPTRRLRAERVLLAMGLEPEVRLGTSHDSVLRTGAAKHFVGAGGFEVDLHWGFSTPSFRFAPSARVLWGGQRSVRIADAVFPTLSAELGLVHLCFHGAKHDWQYWSLIADVVGYIEAGPRVDPSRLLALARDTGLLRTVGVGLGLARRMAGVEIPEGLEAALPLKGKAHDLAVIIARARRALPARTCPRRTRALIRFASRERTTDAVHDLTGKVVATLGAICARRLTPRLTGTTRNHDTLVTGRGG